jgi:hypothetical protein
MGCWRVCVWWFELEMMTFKDIVVWEGCLKCVVSGCVWG